MPSETYGVLEAVVPEDSAELWDLWCTELGANGSEWDSSSDGMAPGGWANPQGVTVHAAGADAIPPGYVRVRHYFEMTPHGGPDMWLAGFRARYERTIPPAKLDWSEKPVEPWGAQWRQHFVPLPLGRRLIVCPPWDASPVVRDAPGAPPPETRLRIVIDPGQGFGTGRHASTALALELIERALTGNQSSPTRVLDVGTGSGILLIAAWLLGAGEPWACDIDPVVEPELRRNLALSGWDDTGPGKFVFQVGTPADLLGRNVGIFPLVIANLTAPLLIEHANDLRSLTSPGGHLILSGMLSGEDSSVLSGFRDAAWTESGRAEAGGWCAVWVTRPAN